MTPAEGTQAVVAVKSTDNAPWRVEQTLSIREGDEARLTPVIYADGQNCESALPSLLINGKTISCNHHGKPWVWLVMEPIAHDYNNAANCIPISAGCVQPLSYRRRELADLHGRDVVATSELVKLLGLGTHWIAIESDSHDKTELIATKGRPAPFQFIVRRNDSYVGYLTERLGLPFVYLPSLTPAGEHQTDAGLGADCVALVIYGQRRLGRKIPYMAPTALKRYTTLVARDGAGEQPVAEGDILHFGFQTAVVSSDRQRLGLLDDEDRIIHTYHSYAEEVSFASLRYGKSPFEVRRWNLEW